MANTFAPFGFSQAKGNGSAPTYEQVVGFCNYNTGAMYPGDPIYQNSDGSVGPGTPGTAALAGVFVGCKYLSVSQGRTIWNPYWSGTDVASGNSVEVYYVNDPNAQFIAQVGGSSSTGLVTSNIGMNVQFNYGTPSTANRSGAYIDITVTPAVTATLPFRVIALSGGPLTQSSTGAYNYAVVAFNNVATKTLTGI